MGIFANAEGTTRRVAALLLEQNDEWQLQRRYVPLESLRAVVDNLLAILSTVVS